MYLYPVVNNPDVINRINQYNAEIKKKAMKKNYLVLADGTVHVLDMDELEEALAGGSITRDQYALAVKTADEVMRFYKEHARSVEDKLHAYRAMFHAPAGNGGKRDKD